MFFNSHPLFLVEYVQVAPKSIYFSPTHVLGVCAESKHPFQGYDLEAKDLPNN